MAEAVYRPAEPEIPEIGVFHKQQGQNHLDFGSAVACILFLPVFSPRLKKMETKQGGLPSKMILGRNGMDIDRAGAILYNM